MEFKEIFLGDHVTIKSSKRIFLKDYVQEGIPFYRSKEIILKFNKQKIDETLYISEELYSSVKSKYGVPLANDILLTSVGTLGVPYLVKEGEKFYFKDGNLTWFSKFDTNVLLPEYLFYWIRSDIGKSSINSISIGSTQKALTMESLKKLKINVPTTIEQEWIISILSTIDEKISLNNSILSNLEEFSQLLFKHWFIDFEFSNEEGQPYKSSGGEMIESELGMIPESFKVRTFKDISKLTMGLSPKSDSYNESFQGIPLLNGAADFKGDKLKPNKYTTDSKRNSSVGDLVFCIRATIGNITYSDKEYSLGRSVAAITPNIKQLYELIYFNLHRQIEALKAQAVGSVIIGLSKPDIENIKVILPSDRLLNKFHEITSSIFSKKYNLDLENEKLENLRDTLLPKLLSGEIEIPLEVKTTLS